MSCAFELGGIGDDGGVEGRGAGRGDFDVAKVEDRGDNAEEVELFSGREADRVEGRLFAWREEDELRRGSEIGEDTIP